MAASGDCILDRHAEDARNQRRGQRRSGRALRFTTPRVQDHDTIAARERQVEIVKHDHDPELRIDATRDQREQATLLLQIEMRRRLVEKQQARSRITTAVELRERAPKQDSPLLTAR